MATGNLSKSSDARAMVQRSAQLPYCIAVVPLTDSDAWMADALGRELYGKLTRDPNDPLSFGSGIPVIINPIPGWENEPAENLAAIFQRLEDLAENVLLVLIAGTNSVLLAPYESKSRIAGLLASQADAEQRRVEVMLVASDPRWQVEAQPLRKILAVGETVVRPFELDLSVDEVLIAASLQLGKLNPFRMSSSRGDVEKPYLLVTEDLFGITKLSAANQCLLSPLQPIAIHQYFHAIQPSNQRMWEKIAASGERLGAVLATGHMASEDEGQLGRRDLTTALQLGWPVLSLSSSDPRASSLAKIARAAAIEHVRQLHFMVVARRLIQRANLHQDTAVISRAPTLLDFSSGLLSKSSSRLLLHPDPVLTPEHREILRAVAPRISMLTPSTLLARNDSETGRLTTPLDSMRIGISASGMEHSDFTPGWNSLHLEDAFVQIARNLLSGGVSLSYGGDFSFRDTTPFTPMLARLAETYRQTLQRDDVRLQIFQPADGDLNEIPEDIVCLVRHLGHSADLKSQAAFTPVEIASLPEGMKYSDMRRVMNANCDARVVIGGKVRARSEERDGYGGRFSGIAEEVFRALHSDQPVYLCGGFGGMARRLVTLFEHPEDDLDDWWDERSEDGNLRFADLKYKVDSHPKRDHLELPTDLRDLASKIAQIGESLGAADDQWLDFNGLTRAENLMLWHSTDPMLMSALITQGLMNWRVRQSRLHGRICIEAVQGDIAAIANVDLVVVTVFDDVAPQGAGAAIDRMTGGLVSEQQSSPGRLMGIRSAGLDADYLYVVSLGNLDEVQSGLNDKIREAARTIAQICNHERFKSVAVVTFAGSLESVQKTAVREMLAGFQSQPSEFVIKWVEYNPSRYEQLVDILRADENVELSTLVNAPAQMSRVPSRYPWFSLTVGLKGEELEVSGLPQEAGGSIWTHHTTLASAELDQLSSGGGPSGKATPGIPELIKRGKRLAELLFGDNLEQVRRLLADSPLAITHNAEASKIPFELLQLSETNEWKDQLPVITTGVHRWLKTVGGSLTAGTSQVRPTHTLRIGLIIDPLGDLDGAKREGEAVYKVLKSLPDKVRVTALGHKHEPATKDAVMRMMTTVDVLHYCGHASFNGQHREKSALFLANDEKLTAKELQELTRVPRVVIFNACEAGRVRAKGGIDPAVHASYSLAEVILRTGVEAFVGTYWEVEDRSADLFAQTLYRELSVGSTLRESVTRARCKLAEEAEKDWANYMLYGDGRFRLG